MAQRRPRTSRHLSRSVAGATAIAICAAMIWVWLGRRLPPDTSAENWAWPTLASLRDALLPSAPADPPAATPAPPPPLVATIPPTVEMVAGMGAAPSFDIVRVAPNGDAVLAGRAPPGAHVTISDDGVTIALATADREGQWVALPTAPLPPGARMLTLASLTIASDAQAESVTTRIVAGQAPLLVVVPSAPNVTEVDKTPRTAVAVLMPREAAPRVLQGLPPPKGEVGDASAGAVSRRLGIDVVDYDRRGAIRFGGTAASGAHLRAYIDDRLVGEPVADTDGAWSFIPVSHVAPGAHRLRIDQFAAIGVAARAAVAFERGETPDTTIDDGRIVVQPGETLWRIARRSYGQGMRYTLIFQANRAQIGEPNRIFPGQVFSMPGASLASAGIGSP